MKFLFFLSLLIIASCSFKKSQLENQTQSGHDELYSEPEAPKSEPKDYQRVIIAATNDIHGHYESHEISFKDKFHADKQMVKVGGVDFISSYFNILRQEYGDLLLVDSGDIFTSKAKEKNFVQDFYASLNYDAVTVGLKDFNLKLPSKYKSSSDFFKDFAEKARTPLLLSNLYELKTARVVEWPGVQPYLLKEIKGVKIGIIGLVPDDIVEQTPVDNRLGLYVESMLQSTLRYSRLLKSLGAQIIVVLTHQALNCGENIAQELKLQLSKVNFEPERKDMCDISGKMGDFLNRLPPDMVDVVVSGRNHQKTANFVNETLVMSNFEDGQSFIYAEFFIDTKSKKLDKKKTVVHQPVMFCQEFFKETNDCYTEDASVDHKVRIPATFLGQPVTPDANIEQKFQSFLKQRTQASIILKKNIQSIVDYHQADLTYINTTSGESKLILLSLSGKEISTLLEDEYNEGQESKWQPSPFHLKDSSLTLSIQGSPVEAGKTYKILADLDDLQHHHKLKKFIGRADNKSLNNVSWNEPEFENDSVTSAMAASETVR